MKLEMDFSKGFEEIEKRSAKSVVLQFPEGLKTRIIELHDEFSKKFPETKFYCLTDPCFGACDIALDKAKSLKADLLIHFGHNAISENKNTLYIPLEYKATKEETEKILKKILKEINSDGVRTITMAAPVQYLGIMREIAKMLEKNSINVILSEGTGRVKEEGQVLGCNYSSVKRVANAEAVVFIGDALFHALGLELSARKRVIFFDAVEMKVRDISKDKELFLRKRFAAIAGAKEAKSFGIVVSTKHGQKRRGLAVELKKLIEDKGKKAIILVSDYILPEYVLGIDVDCFVNTACTRIAIDDASLWKKPIINPEELEIAFRVKDWNAYSMEEID